MTHNRPIEDRISEWLVDEAPHEMPDRVLHATFEQTRLMRRRSARVGWRSPDMSRFLMAVAAGAAVLIAVVAGLGLLGRPSASVGGSPSATSSPPSTAPSASARTSPGPSPSPYSMSPLDFEEIEVPGAFAIADGAGAVWVTSTDGLVRIDPETHETELIPVDLVEANGVRAGDSGVWVSDYGGRALYQVDPERGEVVATIDLESGAYSIALDGNELYVVLVNKTFVYDTETKRVLREEALAGGFPNPLAFGSLWYDAVSRVMRVDPQTFQVEATVEIAPPADTCTVWPLEGVDGIGDSIVLGCYDGRYLSRIDVETNTLAGTYDVGLNGGSSIGAAGGWWAPVGNAAAPGLARIDPASGAVVEVRELGENNLSAGMTTTSGTLWIASPDSDRVLAIPFSALEQ